MTSSTTDVRFTGSIPRNYDRYLGPLLFEFTGADLARRVANAVDGPSSVLEVACGTGISTRHLAGALPEGSTICATDLNDSMLDHARAANGDLPGVTYSQADALDLPFDDASFDAVVCPFGIMFFPDKLAGLNEMTRVLRPGGTLALNVWDSFAQNRPIEIAASTIRRFFESDPPRFLEAPFAMHDVKAVRSLFGDAGYDDVAVDSVSGASTVDDYRWPATGLVTGNPTILEIEERGTTNVDAVIEAVAEALEEAFGPAPAQLAFRATAYVATKPQP